MSEPTFPYAGVYDDVADADSDYEAIKAPHAGDAIESYDSAMISRQPDARAERAS
jgi:hypothetical protein